MRIQPREKGHTLNEPEQRELVQVSELERRRRRKSQLKWKSIPSGREKKSEKRLCGQRMFSSAGTLHFAEWGHRVWTRLTQLPKHTWSYGCKGVELLCWDVHYYQAVKVAVGCKREREREVRQTNSQIPAIVEWANTTAGSASEVQEHLSQCRILPLVVQEKTAAPA